MAEQLRYDGRVAIITGAGNGLGRSYALLLGARGARVVVNDLGGNIHGGGRSSTAADRVVEEIRALGGEAVANHDSVEEGAKIVKDALEAFGTVDIVINNAGILRDVSFHKMSVEDWDLIMKVHLYGSFAVTRAAWPILRDKGYGRLLLTTSAAGIYGNFGQANYGAAKLALVGLANALTQEGRGKGIHVNTIAPIAGSRLTETVLPPELISSLKPEYVAPLVGWLCHEDCKETGGLFEVGAGYVGKLRWERTRGHAFKLGRPLAPEDVAARWERIGDFKDAEHPSSVNESMAPLLSNLNGGSLGGNEYIDLDQAVKSEATFESSYDERDLALYALGVGAASNPTDDTELSYVYELKHEEFHALPTYGVMPAMEAILALAKDGKQPINGLNFGLDRVLHGEQYTELKAPLPPKARLKSTFRLKAAYDKDPHAVVVLAVSTTDESGEELAYNEITTFVKGAGGWGGERGSSEALNVPPAREPDAVIEERIDPRQGLLYRLSGDWNPLHADPAVAKAFGFEKPILHGLCTYGHVARHVIKAFCGNDPRRFRSIKVRFAESVFPGETLITRMWRESPTRIVFETRVKERDKVVIKNAAVELYEQIRQRATKTKSATPPAVMRPTSTDLFAGISAYIAANKELAEKIKTVFQFKLTDPVSAWVLDLKNGPGSCEAGTASAPDVTLELTESDFIAMCTGRADPNKLYFGGRLKIAGNVMASQKLTFLQKIDLKLQDAGAQASAGDAAQAVGSRAAPRTALSGAIFAKLGKRLKDEPAKGLTGKILQFTVREPDASWILDLTGRSAKVEQGRSDEAAAIFTVADEDLAALAAGKAEVRDLFQRGKLRVDGEVRLARELGVLSGLI
jgi:(3R)-3-hydroxyacyl-CoA dehydrogenase / 3a,7a,12a-trihydroxy-5b-cholest-24-enoyl-CoA hydratase / enoyl-CoA hydratase 2